jgi:hypothetical protein
MDDNTVVNTDKARNHWNEDTFHDGRNFISKATGCQWSHETLYESRKGRFYIEYSSDYQGSRDYAEWISDRAAAAWLLTNDHELPDSLKEVAEEVEE